MSHLQGLLHRTGAVQYVRDSLNEAADAWHRFWFEPADALMLGIIRLLCGWMLFYNLLIWTLDLEAFFGDHGLQPLEAVRAIHQSRFVFSFWLWIGDTYLWPLHFLCLLIAAMFCVGFATRITSVLSFLITISYSQRVPVANFGFDQILGMLCLYLSLGPSGAAVSVDNLIRRWRSGAAVAGSIDIRKFASARMAMRLIQLHLCAIYFWAGFSKLKGPSWWTGQAMWNVIANQEYQTIDITWMAWIPWLPFLLAHITIAWEVFFIVLVWNRRLRPLILTIGVLMHVGIGAFLGMWTFGLIMAFAYLAFSDPDVWRQRFVTIEQWLRSQGTGDSIADLDEYFSAAAVGSTSEVSKPALASFATTTQGSVNSMMALASVSGESSERAVPAVSAQGISAEQICFVAASSNDRSTMRRYFREHGLVCRCVADMDCGQDVISRYRDSFVIVNATQFPSAAILDFAADASDRTNLPVLVMLTPAHESIASEVRKIYRADTISLPASLREIRLKMQQMLCTGADGVSPCPTAGQHLQNSLSDSEINHTD